MIVLIGPPKLFSTAVRWWMLWDNGTWAWRFRDEYLVMASCTRVLLVLYEFLDKKISRDSISRRKLYRYFGGGDKGILRGGITSFGSR